MILDHLQLLKLILVAQQQTSWLFLSFLPMMYCCSLLTGIGIGAVSMVAPLYVAEVAAANHRGPLGTAFQLLVTVGIFMAYSIGSAVSWSWLAVTGACLCFLHAILLLIIPETPRWLLAKSDRQVVIQLITRTHACHNVYRN